MTSTRHLVGLLLDTEEDWPAAFEEILRRLGPVSPVDGLGSTHAFDCERITIEPFNNPAELHSAYDASGEMLMHLQKAVDYDVFARSLSIGAETMVMKFQPDQPMHLRYAVEHSFLSPQVGAEVVTISRLVNAFFRWEFNSCETLVRGSEVYPIDYANACPDVALTSLHYYFLRPAAGPDGQVGVPGARARAVHRAPARAAPPVGARRERAAWVEK